jgi:GMP synthase (glutamine-hydrolysing)
VAELLVLKHISCEGPGRLADFSAERGVSLRVVDLERNERLPALDGFAALVVLGGPMNVDEEEKFPWLKAETALIREALGQELPILGLCLGGQLLAKAAGGRVTKNPVKEIGNFFVELTEEGKADPLFAGFGEEFPVFQWHGDTFSDLNGGVLLARSEACAHQAFRWGKNAYGLQFHMEVTEPMAHEWAHEYNPELIEEKLDPSEIAAGFSANEKHYAELSRKLFANFFRIAGI